MNEQIEPRSLIEVLKAQRNEAHDRVAELCATIAMLKQQIAQITREASDPPAAA